MYPLTQPGRVVTAFPLRGRDDRTSHLGMAHKEVAADLLVPAERAALISRLEMIHDLRPIGSVRKEPEFRCLYWNKAAEGGAALVRQMLAFSRHQILIAETLDLNQVAAGMVDRLRRTFGEYVEIEMRLTTALWPALADRAQVESAAEPGHQRPRCHA